MSKCLIATALKEIVDSEMDPDLISEILSSINTTLDLPGNSIEKYDISTIAICLHQLHCIQNGKVRSQVLYICVTLELISPIFITEKYGFDFLVVKSLENSSEETVLLGTSEDSEKKSAFAYIYTLLELYQYLPLSIIRSLINISKSNDEIYNSFRPLVITALLKVSIFCNDTSVLPEIFTIIFKEMVKNGSTKIAPLLSYAVENRLPLIQEKTLAPLLTPLSNFGLFLKNKKRTDVSSLLTVNANENKISLEKVKEMMENVNKNSTDVIKSIILFMRTWPGLLYYGIQCGAIKDMVTCLNHKTDLIIEIFRNLFKSSEQTRSVTDAFSGILLANLIKLDFIDKLNSLAPIDEKVINFMNELLPFTIQSMTTNSNKSKKSQITLKNQLFNIAAELSHENRIASLTQLHIVSDLTRLNWTSVQTLLNVILPNNDNEASSSLAINFYKTLLNFFSNEFLQLVSSKRTEMIVPLSSLMNLLLKKSWGLRIIETHKSFKAAIINSLHLISSNDPSMNETSSNFYIFKCVLKMMEYTEAIPIISKWDIINDLLLIGSKINKPELAKLILREVSFYPISQLTIPFFQKFISSSNNSIFKVAIEHLQSIRFSTPNFPISCFKYFIIPNVKENKNNIERLPIILNLLGEIIYSDQESLDLVAQDVDIQNIILQNSHFIYSIILSSNVASSYWAKKENVAKNVVNTPNTLNTSNENRVPSLSNFQPHATFDQSNLNILSSPKSPNFQGKPDSYIPPLNLNNNDNAYSEIARGNTTRPSFTKDDAYLRRFPSAPNQSTRLPRLSSPDINRIPNPTNRTLLKQLFNKTLENELSWWLKEGNLNYVDVYDKAVLGTFEGKLSEICLNEPSIFNINGFAPPPPHLFGMISKIKYGAELLKKYIPSLLKQIHEEEVKTVRSAIFALSHYSSNSTTAEFVEEFNIADELINTAITSKSYLIKGTILYGLSLFASSHYLSKVLQKRNWQQFRFGVSNCFIPRDPLSLFTPFESISTEVIRIPNPPLHEELVSPIRRLINPKFIKVAKERINEIISHGNCIDSQFAQWIISLISNYTFPKESRAFLLSIINNIPLVPKLNTPSDPKLKEIVRGKIFYLPTYKDSLKGFDQIRIPTKTISQIKGFKSVSPEILLSDDDFTKYTGMTRDDFYTKLTPEEQNKIRDKLTS